MSGKPILPWALGHGSEPSKSSEPAVDARYDGLPLPRACKLQKRREKKQFFRQTEEKHVLARVVREHNYRQHQAHAWLANEVRRTDRVGITVPVENELLALFSVPDKRKLDEMKKALGNEAREVAESFEVEEMEAWQKQRQGRIGRFRVRNWWEHVAGEGHKARRQRLREEKRKAKEGGDGGDEMEVDEEDDEDDEGWETDNGGGVSVLPFRPKHEEL